jgi:hypothetical protein
VAPGIEAIAAHSVLLTDMRCIKILRRFVVYMQRFTVLMYICYCRLLSFNIEQVSQGLEKLNELKKAMKKVNKIPGKVYYSHTREQAQVRKSST